MSDLLSLPCYLDFPPDTRIRLAAADFLGWRYATGSSVRYPYARKYLPNSLVDINGRGIDCSSFTAYILFTAYANAAWTNQSYKDLQIMDASRPWSPIAAVEAAKAGSRVAAPIGGAWHLTQAWKSLTPLSGGHARLSYADPSDPYNLLVLESSSKLNLVGPTWTRTTWATLQKQYPAGVRAIALRSE